MGLSESLAAEFEDEDDDSLDTHDAFLNTSPIQYVSLGAAVSPHTSEGANQVILTLLIDTSENPESGTRGCYPGLSEHRSRTCFEALRREYRRVQESVRMRLHNDWGQLTTGGPHGSTERR